MKVGEIIKKLQEYGEAGKKMFLTSSFQTHSIPLLHIVQQSGIPVEILFINTGFHFPETLTFKREISDLLNLNCTDVQSYIPKILQRDEEQQFYFISDPDYCCYLNKTQPVEAYLKSHDIWINGIRAEQSAQRKVMSVEQATPFRAIRFHPVLDWTAKDIYQYRKTFNLPEHPLETKGYLSIGCEPCTRKFDFSDERNGRWFGMKKTECGLHTDLVKNK